MEGEADMSRQWRSLKGCGRRRDTQSIAFLRTPGIDPLYSGEATTRASVRLQAPLELKGSGRQPTLGLRILIE